MAVGWADKEDNELLALIQDGNGQAFAVLVERHTDRFYRLADRYLQNRAAAEDVVQDAFLKLWENPALWQPQRHSKFTTWFYRIVVNLCLDQHKKKKPEVLDNDALVADDRAPTDELMMREQGRQRAEKESAALPDRQRTAANPRLADGLANR